MSDQREIVNENYLGRVMSYLGIQRDVDSQMKQLVMTDGLYDIDLILEVKKINDLESHQTNSIVHTLDFSFLANFKIDSR